MKKRALTVSVLVTTLAISLGGCSEDSSGDGQSGGGDEKQTVNWWTWDDQQAVSYAKCEAAFEDAHPDINVEISQYGWGDYWTKITAGFVGGTAPDAFQNHPNYYPEFADQGHVSVRSDIPGFEAPARSAFGLWRGGCLLLRCQRCRAVRCFLDGGRCRGWGGAICCWCSKHF